MPRASSLSALSYVGLAVSLLTLVGAAWNAASAWFHLVERVSIIEVHEQYMHGDISRYIPKGADK